MPWVTLIEDEWFLVGELEPLLQGNGFSVRAYSDALEGLKSLSSHPPDILLMDIEMPKLGGIEILQQLRAGNDLPVIFVTDDHGEEIEIRALNAGADDLIRRPFSPGALVARIGATLRRNNIFSPHPLGEPNEAGGPLIRGALLMDRRRKVVLWKGKKAKFTSTEFRILESLAAHPGFVKSRIQLLDEIYGDRCENLETFDRVIDCHIKRMRMKFRDVDPGFSNLRTSYGSGYSFIL